MGQGLLGLAGVLGAQQPWQSVLGVKVEALLGRVLLPHHHPSQPAQALGETKMGL